MIFPGHGRMHAHPEVGLFVLCHLCDSCDSQWASQGQSSSEFIPSLLGSMVTTWASLRLSFQCVLEGVWGTRASQGGSHPFRLFSGRAARASNSPATRSPECPTPVVAVCTSEDPGPGPWRILSLSPTGWLRSLQGARLLWATILVRTELA